MPRIPSSGHDLAVMHVGETDGVHPGLGGFTLAPSIRIGALRRIVTRPPVAQGIQKVAH